MMFSLIGLVSVAIVVFLINLLRKRSTTRYQTEFPTGDENMFSDDQDHPL